MKTDTNASLNDDATLATRRKNAASADVFDTDSKGNRYDVSVIIASYNVEATITCAITSALTQDGVSVEVIVVDDASTDTSWAQITAITDPRVQAVRLSTNSGPGAARNAGLARATGHWLAVLDGDDVLLPGRLARCLRDAAHADVVVDNLRVRLESDGAQFPMFSPPHFARLQPFTLARFIEGTVPHSGNYTLGYLKPLFLHSFITRHDLRYPEDIRIGEDYLLLAEALACGARCILVPEEGYGYTVRKGSISHRLRAEDVKRMLSGDAWFVSRHRLDTHAARAQAKRTCLLRREYGFAQLVEAIKGKKIGTIFTILWRYPAAFLLLYRPLMARLGKRS